MKFLMIAMMIFGTTQALAKFECPKTIQVEVKDLKSTLYSDSNALNEIYDLGEQQTEISFIQAVLQSVNKIQNLSDTLKLKDADKDTFYTSCLYKGKKSQLILKHDYNTVTTGGGVAELAIGYVDYKNPVEGLNPISAKGYQAILVSTLKKLNDTEVSVSKSDKNELFLDLEIQIPLGDFGTDGFVQQAPIGSAKSVTYTIVK